MSWHHGELPGKEHPCRETETLCVLLAQPLAQTLHFSWGFFFPSWPSEFSFLGKLWEEPDASGASARFKEACSPQLLNGRARAKEGTAWRNRGRNEAPHPKSPWTLPQPARIWERQQPKAVNAADSREVAEEQPGDPSHSQGMWAALQPCGVKGTALAPGRRQASHQEHERKQNKVIGIRSGLQSSVPRPGRLLLFGPGARAGMKRG